MFTISRPLLFLMLSLFGIACHDGSKAHETDSTVTVVRPLESVSSVATRARIRALFEQSESIEFRFTPFSEIEIRGYKPRVELMRYSYSYHCGAHCTLLARKLMTRLSTARRAEGECPWITAAVIFRGNQQNDLTHLLVDSTGHCLLIDDATYILVPENSLSYFFEVFDKVF